MPPGVSAINDLQAAEHPQARPTGQSCITASWQRPPGNTALFFRLYIRKQGESEWQRVAQDKDLLTFTVADLQPMTTYEFRVQTYSNHAEGPYTDTFSAATAAGAPTAAPTGLKEKLAEVDSITVCWDPPASKDIAGYYMYYDEAGKEPFVEVDLEPTAVEYTARWLDKDTLYRFQLCSYNASGESPLSPIICVATLADARSRFLSRGRTDRSSVISGSKRHTIRDVPPPPSTTNAKEDGADGDGEGSDVHTVLRQPSKWRKPTRRHSQPALQQSRVETEEERKAREEREQQQERIRLKRASFQSLVSESELQSKFRQRSFRIQAESGGQLATGVYSAEQKESLEEQKEKERKFLEEQLRLKGDDFEAQDVKSLSGTIRGKKNAVRSVLDVFTQSSKFESELLEQLYNEEKNNTIVVYVTSVNAVRQTREDCDKMLKIFENHRKKVRIKDIALDSRFVKELDERLPACEGQVPQAFINYFHVGDLDKIVTLNETGQLGKMVRGFEERSIEPCSKCGGFGFVNCTWCFGSKKSIANKFTSSDAIETNLKCTLCNENGLQRCDAC